MTHVDLHPSVNRLIELSAGLSPDDSRPTPCPEWTVAALLAHLQGMAVAFRAAAHKVEPDAPPEPGQPQHSDDLERHLRELADAWQPAAAWEGMTRVAGLDLPGELTGRVALGELVTHSWDLARATEQDFAPTQAEIEVLDQTYRELRAGNNGDLPGLFGPAITASPEATPLERALAIAGRDPAWTPANESSN